MRTIILIFFLLTTYMFAQRVNFSIKLKGQSQPISPYIYGTNQILNSDYNYTAVQQGGNRMTGYNWENNVSNAGMIGSIQAIII